MLRPLLLLSIFSHVFAFGQIDIVVESNTDHSANVFYVYHENIIQLTGTKDFTGYKVAITGDAELGEIGEPGRYSVETCKDGSCQLIISKNGKQIFTRTYKTEMAMAPVGRIGTMTDSIVSKSQLLVNPFLSIVVPGNFYYRFPIVVYSFEAIFIMRGDSIVTNSPSNQFSEEQKKLARQLDPGDEIYFRAIRFGYPTSYCPKAFWPFTIKIK